MAALCTFLVTMELICVFLGNAAFDTYRQTVVQADQPDYTLLSNHTGSSREVAAGGPYLPLVRGDGPQPGALGAEAGGGKRLLCIL